jgi:hypothetical protein
MEGIAWKLANMHHVDHGHGLIGLSRVNHVEVGDAIVLDVVGKEVVAFWYADPTPSSPKG